MGNILDYLPIFVWLLKFMLLYFKFPVAYFLLSNSYFIVSVFPNEKKKKMDICPLPPYLSSTVYYLHFLPVPFPPAYLRLSFMLGALSNVWSFLVWFASLSAWWSNHYVVPLRLTQHSVEYKLLLNKYIHKKINLLNCTLKKEWNI